MSPAWKVLVTDGHLKTSLSAVRALGRRGVEVHTFQYQAGPTLCSLSRYHAKSHVVPPLSSNEAFDAALVDVVRRERYHRILIASEGALRRISANRESISPHSRVDLPSREVVETALSKEALLQFAVEAGIPVPRTVFHRVGDPVDNIVSRLSFPLVGKTGERTTYERVRYLNDRAELEAQMSRYDPGETVIFQEYVDGDGYGLFALYRDGRAAAVQMHRRLWEYPVTGGPSVLAETADEPALRALGLGLLDRLGWNGLAMVEFKRRRADNRYVLMEINPRLWGSLDLCVASGVDFPWLACLDDPEEIRDAVKPRSTRYLFILPDSALYLASRPARVLQFLRYAFSPSVRTNLALDDPRPLVRQLREAAYWIKVLLPKRKLRYPHGRPRARGRFEFDLHLHSSSSFDSPSRVRSILRRARAAGLSALAVTDHDTIAGGVRAKAVNRDPGLRVIVGSEVRTEAGDIVGLFLDREIRSRKAAEVIHEIHEQGGLALLPHPYSYGAPPYDEALLRDVDLVELRNGRTYDERIEEIRALAARLGKPLVGNSDAHFAADVGCTRNVAPRHPTSDEDLKALLLSGEFEIVSRKAPFHRVPASQTVKAWKGRRPGRVAFNAWWAVKCWIQEALLRLFGEPLVFRKRR